MSAIPKTTTEHKRDGTFRKDRHKGLSLVPIRTPSVPDWLSVVAKAKWQEVAKLLADAGIITAMDLDAIAAYAVAYSQWRLALEHIEENGIAYDSEGGLQKMNPACSVARETTKELAHWGSVLGLSPLSRKKLRVEAPDTDDVRADKFFKNREGK